MVKHPTKNIDITIDCPSQVEPGKPMSIEISLSNGGKPVVADLAVFVVDKAVLDLKDNPIQYLNESYQSVLHDHTYFGTQSTFSSLVSLLGYKSALERLFSRYDVNPWLLQLDWTLFPSSDDTINPLDVPDDIFHSYYKSPITKFPVSFPRPPWEHNIWLGEKLPKSPSVNFGASLSEADKSGGQSTTSTMLRSNFKSTPLFVGQAQVDNTGKAKLDFNLPDNVGKFEIRAYAIDMDNNFGVAVEDFVSKRNFSLVPSAPRLVRTGDVFKAGVMIIPPSSFVGQAKIEVARVCDYLVVLDSPVMVVNLNGSPIKIDFTFSAIGCGTVPLVYKIGTKHILDTNVEKWIVQDAVLVEQLIAGIQEQVMLATSMATSENSQVSEGYVLPSAVPYSGNLSVTAGVGRLSAIQIYIDFALSLQYESADRALSYLMPYITLNKYGTTLSASYITQLEYGVSLLNKLTDITYGLQWSSYPYWKYTSIRLQTQALFIESELIKINSLSTSTSQKIKDCAKIWKSAMISEFVNEATQARIWGSRYSDMDTLAMAYLATGTFTPWEYPQGTTNDVTSDFTLDRLISMNASLSSSGKAALVLALLRDNIQTSVSTLFMTELTNTIRTQGRTAYITEPHSQQPNFLASAISLECYILQNNDLQLIEKIANFIAQENQNTPRYWFSTEQLSHSMLSLANYDLKKQNTQPNLHLVVKNEPSTILDVTFNDPQQPPVKQNLFFEDIQTNGKITFKTTGLGEASIVFAATFVPSTLNYKPVDRGIKVSRIIQLLDPATNNPTGVPIFQASIGQRVLTTIQIIIPDYSKSVTIVDPFPGALEPLDDSIYSNPTSTNPRPYMDYWTFWILYSFSKEFQPSKVVFRGTNLYAGTHTVQYYSLVNTEGNFVLPPTLAYDANQPELMGLAEAGTFNTTDFEKPPCYNDTTNCLPFKGRVLSKNDLDVYVSGFDVTPNVVSHEPGPSSSITTDNNDEQAAVNRLIVGLCVGIGFPLVIGAIALAVYLYVFRKPITL
eukprot:TRINITY_DN5072_c0_g1_i1.p1 TRINITY_DN5072_c0_g1~~TRINITY_DN5072_c0_g1_i1.p1  ORF type:complete len:1026 (-),score=194.89 TRINITY_DN5072_c0_g1_i1:48-3089(-)